MNCFLSEQEFLSHSLFSVEEKFRESSQKPSNSRKILPIVTSEVDPNSLE